MFPPEIWSEILSYYLESNYDGFCPVPLVCKAWKLHYDSSDPRRFELFLSYYPSVYRLATLYVFLHYVEIGRLKRVSLSDRHFLDICTDQRGLCLLDLGGEEIVQISQDGTLIRGEGNCDVISEVCSFFRFMWQRLTRSQIVQYMEKLCTPRGGITWDEPKRIPRAVCSFTCNMLATSVPLIGHIASSNCYQLGPSEQACFFYPGAVVLWLQNHPEFNRELYGIFKDLRKGLKRLW